MEETEHILSGPEFTCEVFDGSLAEFCIPRLKSYPEDCVLQIDAATEEKITASEFLKLSLEVAEGLIKLGLRKGDVVTLASPNTLRSGVTAAGILFSGGILSPLDHNLKPFELKHLIQGFQPKFIITQRAKVNNFKSVSNQLQLDAKIILIDAKGSDSEFLTWDDLKTEVNVRDYVPRKVDDPKKEIVLISCSSGSSGLPKGVALSHFSLLCANSLLTSHRYSGPVLLTSPLYWITGVLTLMIGLSTNLLGIIPKSTDIRHIIEAIEKYRIAIQFLSPAATSQMLELLSTEKHNLDSLKRIFVGGSVLKKGLIQKIKEKLNKNIQFSQNYGLSEMSGPVTFSEQGDALENGETPSVGKLLPGFKAKVVDLTTGKSLGPNKIGECRLLGKTTMICYYNNEKATKMAFDENGWLKTGDLVYYDESDRLYVTGRIKEIIKYRNYQISPEEIEIFITGLPGVVDAAVVPIPHDVDGFHLKALVVKLQNCPLTEENIIQSVKENLSDAKHLRAGVQLVESLPKTSTGKLQRGEIQKMFDLK